jgi:DeoR/GlpR family transcriptional regulator of sugar metabolism
MLTETSASPAERHEFILSEAFAHKRVRIKDLASRLGVHEITVRRDLDALSEQGLLERTHGGARLRTRASDEVAYSLRLNQHSDAKTRIALAALELVQDGDTIALDASTTVLALAGMLGVRNVTAIATSLDAANALASANVPFTLIGGTFHARARSFVGPLATATLKKLHPDKVFFSSKGFTLEAGFTDAHLPETEMKEQLIKSGSLIVAMLDHTKFGRTALNTITSLERVDVLVTDKEPSREVMDALEMADIRLVVYGG